MKWGGGCPLKKKAFVKKKKKGFELLVLLPFLYYDCYDIVRQIVGEGRTK